MSATLSDTFSLFFGGIDIDEATQAVAEYKAKVEAGQAARQSNDWKTLEKLGFAGRDWQTESSWLWEFHQQAFDELVKKASMTPEQYMEWRNSFED